MTDTNKPEKETDQPKTPNNETGNQNARVEINRKTERSDRPEQA